MEAALAALRERIAAVRRRIASACQRCGRDPSTVTLVVVTKGVSAATIKEAVACGLTELGENRVQEARSKRETLRIGNAELGIRWHLIGHLQRNKAKDAVELFEVVHSLDSAALAEELERQAARQGEGLRVKGEGKSANPLEVFIQVNISGEQTKFGRSPDDAMTLAERITGLSHLRLVGLMTIPPFVDTPELSRPVFRSLRELRDSLVSQLHPTPSTLHLSMGMSQDFEVAIEEGADYIRVGTALFGT